MNEKIKEVAESLIGIPYKHNGRSREGVDCWGIVYLFFKELGIKLPVDDGRFIDDEWYRKEPDRYINGLRKLGYEVGHYKNLQPLDIPYFILYKDVITHSGVMLDEVHFLHVLIDKEVMIDKFARRFWRRKYAGAIRTNIADKIINKYL